MNIRILWKSSDVAPFIDTIRARADEERKSFGFLPSGAYQEAVDQEKLLVAVASSQESDVYAGHLMLGGVYPQGRIFQAFVDRAFRRQGVGRRLVHAAIRKAEAANFLSISLKVADDLVTANAFWEKMEFVRVGTKAGGRTRGRSINIRGRVLGTPSLFDLMHAPEAQTQPDLRLVERLSARTPIYLFDLNVLFDIVKKRASAIAAGRVIGAGMRNFVRLAITSEFVTELRRSSKPATIDPTLELALQLPRLSEPPQPVIEDNVVKLGHMIFPDRAAKDRLTVQDRSDLRHLATAIYHRTAGFITGEKAILRTRSRLLSEFGIDVVGVAEFARVFEQQSGSTLPALHALGTGADIRVSELKEGEVTEAREFLGQMYVPPQLSMEALAAGDLGAERRRILVRSDEKAVAYASWDVTRGPENVTDLFICANEDHVAAETITDHLIDRICTDASRSVPALIRLREPPGHSISRRIAIVHGFRPVDERGHQGSTLQKVCVGRSVDRSNWATIRRQLYAVAGVGLPEEMPQYEGPRQVVPIDSPSGSKTEIPIKDLETLLSPVLFLFPSRGGVIVPIQRVFADDLFGTSSQFSLLASPEAVLLNERAYFSRSQNLSVLVSNTPIVFYESSKGKGRSSAIAAARVVDTFLVAKGEISPSMKRRGVVEETTLERLSVSRTVAATTFDNIMVFEHPVPLQRLREIGCVDRANLVTARRISANQIAQIIGEGQGDG